MTIKSKVLVDFGEKVRELRLSVGISQEELASRANLHRTYIGMIERAEKNLTLENIEKIANALNLRISDLFGAKKKVSQKYIFNKNTKVKFKGKTETLLIENLLFEQALEVSNQKIAEISNLVPSLFKTLGMRNLSSFVGENFVDSISNISNSLLVKNPHQDGYPDLLVMTDEGKQLLTSLVQNLQDKNPFSNFETGGIEVKATCGSVPTPKELKKKGLTKPNVGDQRIKLMKSYDWKAHHRLTNNLIGLVWDFINEIPTIAGVFFSSSLTSDDWGEIIKPKDEGGRTTSVSIMPRSSVAKMYQGWIAVLDDERYIKFFNSHNRGNLI
jgi:transcriptional regulator with XRE-family HTH domain